MKHLLNETHMLGSKVGFLYIASLISIFFGIYVIITKNPVLSVLFLIGLFSTIAVYLIMIGLHFIGLSYLLVYVGAISILFLFILMLINVRVSELRTDNSNSIILAIVAVLCFNYCIDSSLPYGATTYDIKPDYLLPTEYLGSIGYTFSDVVNNLDHTKIGSVTSKSWDGILIESSHITLLGNILYTNLFILFILTSLILLLAMVGSIVMTVNKPLTAANSTSNKLSFTNRSGLVNPEKPYAFVDSTI